MQKKTILLSLLIILVLYIVLFIALMIGYAIDRTSLAGPGLDAVVFLGITIYTVVAVIINVWKRALYKCVAHVIGLLIIIFSLTLVH